MEDRVAAAVVDKNITQAARLPNKASILRWYRQPLNLRRIECQENIEYDSVANLRVVISADEDGDDFVVDDGRMPARLAMPAPPVLLFGALSPWGVQHLRPR